MTNLYDFDKRLNTCSSSEWQASVRSVKLCSATLCTGVFLFYIKRHLMSGNEIACSLGSSSAKIACVWTQKTRWKTLANNACRYSSRCVRALRSTPDGGRGLTESASWPLQEVQSNCWGVSTADPGVNKESARKGHYFTPWVKLDPNAATSWSDNTSVVLLNIFRKYEPY